ncbi:MAG: RDD family protein, partial [Nitrospirota bacterium]
GYFVSFFLLGLGFVMIAFDRNKRGFHDFIAGTCVVKVE